MKTYLYRASNLKSTTLFWPLILSGSQFLAPVKNLQFLRFIHNNRTAIIGAIQKSMSVTSNNCTIIL